MVSQVVVELGFSVVGQWFVPLPITFLWNPEKFIHLAILEFDQWAVAVGSKEYALLSQSEKGRTFIRDLPGFYDYVMGHFPQSHVSLSVYRDLAPEIIPGSQIVAKRHREYLHYKQLLDDARQKLKETQQALEIIGHNDQFSFSQGILAQQMEQSEATAQQLKPRVDQLHQQLAKDVQWLKIYEETGHAMILLWRYSTVPHVCTESTQGEVIRAIVNDIIHTRDHSVRQKLGGQLAIQVQEVREPHIGQLGMWATFSPKHLNQLKGQLPKEIFEEFRQQTLSYVMVAPGRDISTPGHVEPAQRYGAMALREFLKKVPVSKEISRLKDLPRKGEWLGHLMHGNRVTETPLVFPTSDLLISYVSGKTRTGKSVMARNIVENAIISHPEVNVIVLDPTSEWLGLAFENTDIQVLKRFEQLKVPKDHCRGFPAKLYAPGNPAGLPLPKDPSELIQGISVVSFKERLGLDDMYREAEKILKAVYLSAMTRTSEMIHLIVFEEAHKWLKGPMSLQHVILELAKEKVKYGCRLLFATQSTKDAQRRIAGLRDQIHSFFFLNSTDPNETDWIGEITSTEAVDTVKHLNQGEALVRLPGFEEPFKIFVRPPFSFVDEPGEELIRSLCKDNGLQPGKRKTKLDEIESSIIYAAKDHHQKTDKYPTMMQVAKALGFARGGKIKKYIDQLEARGIIRTEKNEAAQGKPRIIIPLTD